MRRVEGGWSGGGLTVSLEFADCPAVRTRLRVWQVGVRRACVRRTPVALDNFFVVHAEVRRLPTIDAVTILGLACLCHVVIKCFARLSWTQ